MTAWPGLAVMAAEPEPARNEVHSPAERGLRSKVRAGAFHSLAPVSFCYALWGFRPVKARTASGASAVARVNSSQKVCGFERPLRKSAEGTSPTPVPKAFDRMAFSRE